MLLKIRMMFPCAIKESWLPHVGRIISLRQHIPTQVTMPNLIKRRSSGLPFLGIHISVIVLLSILMMTAR